MGFLPPIRRIVRRRRRRGRRCSSRPRCRRRSRRSRKEFSTIADAGGDRRAIDPGGGGDAVRRRSVGRRQGAGALIHLLKDASLESVLVFSRTKHGADRIARKLEGRRHHDGHAAFEPHAGPAPARAQALQVRRRARAGRHRYRGARHRRRRHFARHQLTTFRRSPRTTCTASAAPAAAQAIGDAISFVTHDDADNLRRLERFLGRGITRKKLDGYVANAPQSPSSHPPSADKGARPKAAWKPKGSRSGSFGPKRFGQRRSRPQGRRGRT